MRALQGLALLDWIRRRWGDKDPCLRSLSDSELRVGDEEYRDADDRECFRQNSCKKQDPSRYSDDVQEVEGRVSGKTIK